MKDLKYKETQPMYWLVVLFIIIILFILLATYFQWGSKPITSWLYAILLMGINILPILALYTMKITIDEEMASVKFGIGLIKRNIHVQDLDLTSAKVVTIPWYTGIGYRITNRGTFFNTKPGSALLIKTKSRNTEFFVGTKHATQIIAILKEIQNV